jgi:hypothetical protein
MRNCGIITHRLISRRLLAMPSLARPVIAILTAALLLSPSSFAFDTPLSDQAVREAYFLGQRHDGTFPSLLGKYIKFLPPPKFGPYISSITFLTPFAQLVQLSDRHAGSYSAQQARLDHLGQEEFVQIFVEIQLTPSYAAFIASPTSSRSGSPSALIPRPNDFWRDFQVQIYDGDQPLYPSASHGHANYNCAHDSPCFLAGATLQFDFPAEAFTSDSATIEVLPPEGDPVSVDFYLYSLR